MPSRCPWIRSAGSTFKQCIAVLLPCELLCLFYSPRTCIHRTLSSRVLKESFEPTEMLSMLLRSLPRQTSPKSSTTFPSEHIFCKHRFRFSKASGRLAMGFYYVLVILTVSFIIHRIFRMVRSKTHDGQWMPLWTPLLRP